MRPDYCPIGNQPCQSLCDTPCKSTKREWAGLSAEEIHDTPGYQETREMYRFALAVETKLKEKNT